MVVGVIPTMDTFRSYSCAICCYIYFLVCKNYGEKMSREYTKLSCGCLVSCNGGGGLLGTCHRDNCQFTIWVQKHRLCHTCDECLLCSNHDEHSEKLDGLDYLKSILGVK